MSTQNDDESNEVAEQPAVRYEAILEPGQRTDVADIADVERVIDVDRLPSPPGEVRALLRPEDLKALVDSGVEVRLVRSRAVQPVDPSYVRSDDEARAWLDELTSGLDREGDD